METEKNIDDVRKLAAQIKRYIKNRPNAGDSLEGIATWWLRQQRTEDNLQLVEKAVTMLLTQGVIEKRTSPAGKGLYFVSAVKPEE